MELEEMKALWQEMSVELEKQKKLTDSLVIKMTKVNYRSKINKILIPETIGVFGCLLAMIYILAGLQKLNTWYLLVCGIVAALILGLLSLLSGRAVYKIGSLHISKNNYKESLLEYSKAKTQLMFVQKLTFYLGSMLMLCTLPVMGMLIGRKDFFKVTRLWYWYAIAFPFFYYFAGWVFKSYRKIASDAENILKELDAD